MAISDLGTKLLTTYQHDVVFVGKQLETPIGYIGGKEHTAYLQVCQ